MTGCSGDGGKPQSIASPQRVAEIVKMREIFDRAGGKWESASAADKAEYTRLAGGDAQAKSMWAGMGSAPGAVPGK